MIKDYFKRPKSPLNFESQTENEIRTDIQNKLVKYIENVHEHSSKADNLR